jgi:putative membrane protein
MAHVALTFAFLAAALHVIVFVFESVLWTREPIWRRFKLESQDQAELTRPLAFNQGFYNLFLAVGTLVGVISVLAGASTVGWTLIIFATASMAAAAAVLVSTGWRYARPAATQALFPLLCLVFGLLAQVTSV